MSGGTIAVGGVLPDMVLHAAPDGRAVRLRPRGRVAVVSVFIHGPECDSCTGFLRRLSDRQDALTEWDGRWHAVVPGTVQDANAVRSRLPIPSSVLADPEKRSFERCGIDEAAVLIADQWGEVCFVKLVDSGHEFPDPSEIVDWSRFLAIQCPECQGEAW